MTTFSITNPKARNVAYILFAVCQLALGSIIVFCGASDDYHLPVWVTPAAAALAYIGGILGFVASAHTDTGAVVGDDTEGTVPAV